MGSLAFRWRLAFCSSGYACQLRAHVVGMPLYSYGIKRGYLLEFFIAMLHPETPKHHYVLEHVQRV